MKLHLPLGLLSSLIACMAAVSSPHALAETYTWLGGTDGWIHTNANWNPAPTNYANVWAGTSANIMQFSGPYGDNVQKAVKAQFNSLSLGGINVAAGASGFSVSSSDGGSRVVNFRAPGEGQATVFNIGEDFSLGSTGTAWEGVSFYANTLFQIAAGKTMNVYGALAVGEGITDPPTITVGGVGYSGTLILNSAAQTTNVTDQSVNRNRQAMTANWMVTGGATLQLNNATALGSGMVNLNGGNLKAQHDATYNNTLTVSGSSGLTVNAATQFSNVTLAAAGSLNMNGGTLGIAAAGSLTLGASGTITGNLTLGNSSLLNFSALPASGASLLNVTGTLTVNSELLLGQGTIDGVAWTEGSYDLISAGTVTGVPASSFVLGDNLLGSWSTGNGKLTLVVAQVALLEWKGGDGIWSVTAPAASPWKDDGVYNDNFGVVMGDIGGSAPQTVTIDGAVSPTIIMVQADTTDYVWDAAAGGGSLEGNGNLEKTGNAKLTINTANTNYTGKVILGGGTLEMGDDAALGAGSLSFDGGILQYGAGVTADISGQISSTSKNSIKVDTNGNAVTWASVDNYKAMAMEKSGDGTLNLGAAVYAGALTVDGGSVSIASGSVQTRFSAGVTVNAGGTLAISSAIDGMPSGNSANIVINGMSGAGRIELDNQAAKSRFYISGDNSSFTGELVASGLNNNPGSTNDARDLQFATAASMGRGTLTLNGRGFWMDAVNTADTAVMATINVLEKGTYLNGGSGKSYYFGGAFTGSGTVTTALGDAFAYLTGDMTGFHGAFTRTGNALFTWAFGNNTAATLNDGKLFGDGVVLKADGGTSLFKFSYTNDLVLMNATVGAEGALNARVEQAGTGTLVLTQDNTATGTLTITSGTVQLGNGEGTGSWVGQITGAGALIVNRAGGSPVLELNAANNYQGGTTLNGGTVKALGAGSLGTGNVSVNGGSVLDMNNQAIANNITITKGGLQHAGAYATAGGVTVNAEANSGDIDLGGLSGDKVGGINTATAGTAITGLTGNLTLTGNNSLHVGANNTTYAAAGDQKSLLQFNDTATGTVSFGGDASDLTLHMDIDTDILIAMRELESVGILLTDGTITGLPSSDLVAWLNQHLTFNATLESLGFGIKGVEGGSIIISGRTDQIYISSVDGSTVTEIPALNSYAQVIVDTNLTLNFDVPAANTDKTIIRHLSSGTGSTGNLVVNAAGDGSLDIELANDLDDSVFNGNLTVNGDGADLIKTGEKTLVLNGNVNTSNAVVAREGTLALNGSANNIGTLTLSSASADEPVRVVIGGTTTATLADDAEGGSLQISAGGTLKTAGDSTLDQATTISGAGRLNVQEGSSLTLAGEAGLFGTSVTLNGTLSLSGTGEKSILALSGAGTLALNGNALSVTSASAVNGSFSGTLDGEGSIDVSGKVTQVMQTGSSTYDLGVHGGGTLVLKGTSAAPALDYRNVTVGASGTLRIEAIGNGAGDPNTTLNVGSVDFQSGSMTEFVYNLSAADPFGSAMLTADSITIGNGAGFTLANMTGNTGLGTYDNLDGVVLMTADAIDGMAEGESMSVGTSGLFAVYYKDATMVREGNNIVLNATVQQDNIFKPAVNSHNSGAGSELLWGARNNLDATSRLGQVMNAISTMVTGSNPDLAGASRALAAVAGSTVNALGTAQKDALRDQMGWIRNRTTLMGVNPAYINEDLPYFHMWMEGTGSYAKLDTRGDESGYQLTTWGGTVGMDVDLSDHFTMGAAFTANYGDLTASAADSADGHLDSYYANLFGRYQSKRWAHTLILTGGWNDAKLNRTVNYGEGSYRTQGNTSGWGFGAMYELTYDVYLNEDKSSILQPLANASVVTTRMDGYTETGAGNAGLNVGKQEWTTGTVALGGRWMGLIGSNIFGREALAEFRVNAAQDMGDRRGETNVALLGNPGFMQSVRGAKVGTTALQIGAGLSVPVGTQGTVFINGNADFRDGANSVNGSIGYRYDF
ncbi:autotransporter domain-containing protein [Akkermansia sp. EB-AMDK43]|uniref:Autotransporter domain-containing protein n=10 Tax=Akkermansia TaxID=239934 RepID=A0ABT0R591_9BACT|nr:MULTISPECIES: autotransporter domain-containing protein [Akkermansia]MBT9604564.1 autotransporter domain-containing protein [Akkermansia muciniphila]MBP8663051.1 autotransporter domain-containing protein [Akkermansia sp.]MCL6656264.1 autotransporter domain-containing protein [Akkermansia massiliensis]QWP48113.1 autotransporter domain-containing protein [Akkermansia massiliensis]WMX37476.1 autotransporter domain-containing protein [Akkermansia sp. EB-AMDK43]